MANLSLVPAISSLDAYSKLVMTSRELASLTEKRHDSVKRTIDMLAENGVISKPQIVDGEKSANGVVEKLYRVGKRDSYVIVAQLSPEFTARLVDRWQELEAKAAPGGFSIPTTLSAALRLAADQQDTIVEQQFLLKKAAPKIELVDNFLSTENGKTGSVVAKELAKEFNIGRNRMYAALQKEHVFNRYNEPSQRHVDLGRFYMQTDMYTTEEGVLMQTASVRFTAKGEFYTRAMLIRLGLSIRKAA